MKLLVVCLYQILGCMCMKNYWPWPCDMSEYDKERIGHGHELFDSSSRYLQNNDISVRKAASKIIS